MGQLIAQHHALHFGHRRMHDRLFHATGKDAFVCLRRRVVGERITDGNKVGRKRDLSQTIRHKIEPEIAHGVPEGELIPCAVTHPKERDRPIGAALERETLSDQIVRDIEFIVGSHPRGIETHVKAFHCDRREGAE